MYYRLNFKNIELKYDLITEKKRYLKTTGPWRALVTDDMRISSPLSRKFLKDTFNDQIFYYNIILILTCGCDVLAKLN